LGGGQSYEPGTAYLRLDRQHIWRFAPYVFTTTDYGKDLGAHRLLRMRIRGDAQYIKKTRVANVVFLGTESALDFVEGQIMGRNTRPRFSRRSRADVSDRASMI